MILRYLVLNIPKQLLFIFIFSLFVYLVNTQSVFTYSDLTVETLGQGVKYIQN